MARGAEALKLTFPEPAEVLPMRFDVIRNGRRNMPPAGDTHSAEGFLRELALASVAPGATPIPVARVPSGAALVGACLAGLPERLRLPGVRVAMDSPDGD